MTDKFIVQFHSTKPQKFPWKSNCRQAGTKTSIKLHLVPTLINYFRFRYRCPSFPIFVPIVVTIYITTHNMLIQYRMYTILIFLFSNRTFRININIRTYSTYYNNFAKDVKKCNSHILWEVVTHPREAMQAKSLQGFSVKNSRLTPTKLLGALIIWRYRNNRYR